MRHSHSSFLLVHSEQRVSPSALMHLTAKEVGSLPARGTRRDWNERTRVPLRQRQLLHGWVLARLSVDMAGRI